MAYGDNNTNTPTPEELARQKFEADKARFNAEQNAKFAKPTVPAVQTTPASRPIVPGQTPGNYVPQPQKGVPQATPPSRDIPTISMPQPDIPNVPTPRPYPDLTAGTRYAGAEAAPRIPGTATPAPAAPAIDHKMSDLQWNRVEKYNPENRTPFHDLSKPGKFGRVLSTIGNVAGDIFAPSTMALIPGTQMHNALEEKRAVKGYEAAQQGEREAALAQRALREPVNKIVGHYVNENGQQVWKRESGQEETSGETFKKPEYQYIQNQKGPNGEAISGMVDKNDPRWTGKEQDFAGHNVGDYKFVASGQEAARPGSNNPRPLKHVGPDGMEHVDLIDKDGNVTKKDIVSPGPAGTYTVLTNPLDPNAAPSLLNNKTKRLEEIIPPAGQTTQEALHGNMPPQSARAVTMKYTAFQHNYEKPATDTYQQYKKFEEALKAAKDDPQTGAAGMTEWAMHMGATFGSIAHTTQGEKMAEYHKNALPLLGRIEQLYNQFLVSGSPITLQQGLEFEKLIKATMQIQWQTNAREAEAQHFPISSIPRDLTINMRTASGKVVPVTGDKVQEAIDHNLQVE